MDQKPKSCERSSSTPNKNSFGDSFPRAMRGRKTILFFFSCHFDFTPWPRYFSWTISIQKVAARGQTSPETGQTHGT